MKIANITPAHKKDESTDKENYRPVSVLPLLPKVFERLLYDQLSEYLEKYLSTLLYGFRKAHSTQHVLFKLLQRWQEELDKSDFIGTILMDLSKAYDCLPRGLLVAKFEAYGIDKTGLNLIHNYLLNREQRTKINSAYSDWYDIVKGVPQGSILGPLLFNLFVNDLFLFFERTNICNSADDNTIYSCQNDLKTILEDPRYDMVTLLRWFKENSMKANSKKFQFMILGKTPRQIIMLNINQPRVESSQKVVLLGLTIDNQLTFKDHVDVLCSTANYKLNALRRTRKYLTLEKAKLLCNAFINSQFNYASMIWMFCSKKDYLKIEKIQYKALKITYNSSESYEELLTRSNEMSIHQKHLGALATEIYKFSYKFRYKFRHNHQQIPRIMLPSANSTYYGINSVLFRACLLWNRLQLSIKQSHYLNLNLK